MEKKSVVYKAFDMEYKIDDEKREIVAIGSKQVVDRDNDVIYLDGINLKNFKKTPVVLWSHDSWSPPIGKSLKTWVDGKNLMFKIKFAEEEIYPFADTIYKLIKGDYLNAFSIGFRPDYEESKWNEKRGGYDFFKSELMEISVVNVPANPAALIQSKSIQKALKDKVINSIELDEFKTLIEEMVAKKDKDEKDLEDLIENVKTELKDEDDNIEKDAEDTDDKSEQTVKKETIHKCTTCGHDLICPYCDDIYKDDDSDPYAWIFKDFGVDNSNDNSDEDPLDELLNKFNEEK